jgi:predicted dehydrogenase
MQEKLRVGVVGMGKMGILHAGILNVLPNVELAGVCEPVKLTNRVLKKVFKKALVVEDVSKFSKLNLDGLFITTPTRTHYSVVKEVLEGNLAKNLFVEKPLSASYNESKELCGLIKGKGVGMVGYVRRFMVTFMKAKELLDLGAIGHPVTFSINTKSSDFYGINDPAVSIARGGAMKDLGCYPIDLLLWYFGACDIETASIESITGPGAVDAAHFTVKGGGSAPPGEVSVSWCAEGYRMPEVEFSIVGSKGSILANDDYVRLVVGEKISTYYRLNLNDTAAFWLGAPEYYREDECFIKAVGQNMGSQPSFDSAAKVESVIEDVERRAKRN